MTPVPSLLALLAMVTPTVVVGHAGKRHSRGHSSLTIARSSRHRVRSLSSLPSRGGGFRRGGSAQDPQDPSAGPSKPGAANSSLKLGGGPVSVAAEDLQEAKTLAQRLLDGAKSGAVVFTRPERETRQLQQIVDATAGDSGASILLSLPLLRALSHLADVSSPEKPFIIHGLYRPLRSSRSHEPHGLGQAVDIGGFGGHRILTANPDECVEAIVAIVQALEPGAYRLGLPKAPEDGSAIRKIGRGGVTKAAGAGESAVPSAGAPSDPSDGLDQTEPADPAERQGTGDSSLIPHPSSSAWPFFPAPRTELIALELGESEQAGANSAPQPLIVARRVLRFANCHYAPLEDVTSTRVRDAIQAAIGRGANVHSLFPDGLNHLHLDVKPEP